MVLEKTNSSDEAAIFLVHALVLLDGLFLNFVIIAR